MKKLLNCIKKKVGKVVALATTFILSLVSFAFADAGSVASSSLETGMNLVAVIPAAMGIFAFINAGIAFSQSQQEGGNAQASAKMSNNIVAGIVCIALAIMITTVFKGLVTSLISG